MRRTIRGGALGAAAMLCTHVASAQLGVPLYGDVNLDGVVDNDDLTIVSMSLGRVHTDFCTTNDPLSVLDGDANHDGYVNTTDYLLVVSNFNESLGAIPAITGVDISSSYNSTTKKVTATDTYSGSGSPLLVDPSGPRSVWGPLPTHLQDSGLSTLEPTVTLVSKDDGFDLVFLYDNTSGIAAMQLGRLHVPNLAFTNPVHVRRFLTDSSETTYSPDGTDDYSPATQPYPDGKYSPIEVVRGDIDASGTPEYTVAVALLYPVLEYGHAVRVSTLRDDELWHVRFDLNQKFEGPPSDPEPCGDYAANGNIQPGETREYRITVRFMRASTWTSTQPLGDPHENDWLRLLLDYRRYFRQTYGLVQYVRDPRPMLALNVSVAGSCDENDYGFRHATNIPPAAQVDDLEPDIHGWGGWVSVLSVREGHGYKRFMLRAPSGFFCPSGENLPFQFTSNWWAIADNDPNEPILNTLDLVQGFATGGTDRQLGLWWGHSMRVMDDWPTHEYELLDPCNSTLTSMAMDEMDGASFVGASAIGLDAVGNLRVWARHSWIRTLIAAYPAVSFFGEPRQSDIMHTLGPSWIQAMHDNPHSHLWVRGPNALADMLVPGHETHAGVRQAGDDFDSQMEVMGKALDFASWGFVPHIFVFAPDISTTPTLYDAVESWLDSVPSDILASE